MKYELPEGYSYTYDMSGETADICLRAPDITTPTGTFVGSDLRCVKIKKVEELDEALDVLAHTAHLREDSIGRARALKEGLLQWATENEVEIEKAW